tara:strand:+ start:966 stop:1202 length:237 start_codon:yes stop_codon:yes gene_type:complete
MFASLAGMTAVTLQVSQQRPSVMGSALWPSVQNTSPVGVIWCSMSPPHIVHSKKSMSFLLGGFNAFHYVQGVKTTSYV